MHLGLLNKQIVIKYNASTTRDDAGQDNEDWQTLKTIWAAVNYKKGGEKHEADKLTAYSEQTFTIHSSESTDITRKMRIEYNSQTFDIGQTEPIEPGYTRIYAKEKE